jgi:hypothetical protein
MSTTEKLIALAATWLDKCRQNRQLKLEYGVAATAQIDPAYEASIMLLQIVRAQQQQLQALDEAQMETVRQICADPPAKSTDDAWVREIDCLRRVESASLKGRRRRTRVVLGMRQRSGTAQRLRALQT